MSKKFGFTLIELLTVVLILGVLTAVALPQYRKVIQRAEATNALASLKTIFESAKRYKAANSSWPTSLRDLDVDLFDLSEQGNMGEFQYTLSNEQGGTVSACRLADGSANNTFCLKAQFHRRVTAHRFPNAVPQDQRDVYICQFYNERFQDLCEFICSDTTPDNSVNECAID